MNSDMATNSVDMKVKVLDKTFRPFISKDEIKEINASLAAQMSKDLRGQNPLFLPVLNGSFMFAADLLRALDFDAEVCFVKLSSYSGTQSTGVVKQLIGVNENVKGRNVVVVEDIVETGLSMLDVIRQLKEHGAASVKICSFVFKPHCFHQDFKVDYVGRNIADDFIVGYGLDYNGYGRTLEEVYVLDE